MPTITGPVTKDELRTLLQRGWRLDTCERPEDEGMEKYRTVTIYVDNDLISIMSGPDWDEAVKEPEVDTELNTLWSK